MEEKGKCAAFQSKDFRAQRLTMSDPNLSTMSLAGSFATEAATPEGPALVALAAVTGTDDFHNHLTAVPGGGVLVAAFTTNWWVAFLVSELVRLTSPPQVAAL